MGNGNKLERLWKLETQIRKLVLEGKRDPAKVADVLQEILEEGQEPPDKFEELMDLGIITVPARYNPDRLIDKFLEEHREDFRGVGNGASHGNFGEPIRVLKSRDVFRVKVFRQAYSGRSTSRDRVEFLNEKKAVHLGTWGLIIVFEQKSLELRCLGGMLNSFHGKEYSDDNRGLVTLKLGRGESDFYWHLNSEPDPERDAWKDHHVFLGFFDLPSDHPGIM